MAAYVIAGSEVTDAETLGEYAKQVRATLEPFGGQVLVRNGRIEVVEGTWTSPRLVLLAFPSREHARNWYFSDAYQAIIPGRHAGTRTDFFMFVDGVE
jgi:uncharacterized protein (DUF1330 family)